MLRFFTLLLVLQLIGEGVAAALTLPVPGPVIGMAMLFVLLVLRGEVPDALQSTADGLLTHLSLLFVPAGVGVMQHLFLVRDEAGPIVLSLVVGTVLAIAATALVMDRLTPREGADRP
ncbi:MAG: CidA/LrgA family protein [Pseudomonadota bacterium]